MGVPPRHGKIVEISSLSSPWSPGAAVRETLRDELQAFIPKLGNSGRATFEAAGSAHDDTVLSLSMAVLAAKTRASARPIEFVRSFHVEK
jgi:hypothetical protein